MTAHAARRAQLAEAEHLKATPRNQRRPDDDKRAIETFPPDPILGAASRGAQPRLKLSLAEATY